MGGRGKLKRVAIFLGRGGKEREEGRTERARGKKEGGRGSDCLSTSI